jgi:hypothetical protein
MQTAALMRIARRAAVETRIIELGSGEAGRRAKG